MLALAIALIGCGRAVADVTLASGLPQAPKVSALGETLAWSVFEPATGSWRLAVRHDGITQILPIAPRSTPFDVDLGDDMHGGLVASYSRCSAPARGAEMPHGCRLYYYDFATGAERPIAAANPRGDSQFDPSIAAGRVAFARIGDRRRVGAGNRARIYLQRLAGGRPRGLPGGFGNDSPATGPTSLDLGSTALAFAWDAQGPTAFAPFSLDSSQVSLDYLARTPGDGEQVLVALGTGGEVSSYKELSPTLDAGALYYAETGIEEGGGLNQLRSLTLPAAHAGVASVAAAGTQFVSYPGIQSTATSAAGTIYSRCSWVNGIMAARPCEVALAERVDYADPDREVAAVARPTAIALNPQMTVKQLPGHVPGNWLAWSAYDPSARDYRLMLRAPSGAVAAAPVAPRAVPFDVELGPRAGGGLIAVYSRCRTEPRLDRHDMLPLPATARGCGLYRYDIGSPGERRIPGSGSRFLPSVWFGELAFAERRPGGERVLYIGSLNGRGHPRRLAGGPAGIDPGLGPRALALSKGRVAFVWELRTRSGLRSELRLDERGAHQRLLESVESAKGNLRELSPSFTRGAVAWASRRAGPSSRIEIFVLAGGRHRSYLAPGPIEGVAANDLLEQGGSSLGGVLFYARGDSLGATIRRIDLQAPSAFRPTVRQLPELTR